MKKAFQHLSTYGGFYMFIKLRFSMHCIADRNIVCFFIMFWNFKRTVHKFIIKYIVEVKKNPLKQHSMLKNTHTEKHSMLEHPLYNKGGKESFQREDVTVEITWLIRHYLFRVSKFLLGKNKKDLASKQWFFMSDSN